MTPSLNGSTPRAASSIRVGTAIPSIRKRPLAALERSRALSRIAEARLDHVMFGDHISFYGGFGMDGLAYDAEVDQKSWDAMLQHFKQAFGS